MPCLWQRILILPFLTIAVSSGARAELLYFKGGGRLQAPATVRDGVVKVESAVGDYSFLPDDFLKIVSGYAPEREWPTRRDAALKEGAEARFKAAWWALENGLVPESVAMLRSAHTADAGHQPTARLVRLLNRLDRPCVDRDVTGLSLALGLPLENSGSPHVLLLHQIDPEQAAIRLDLLERVLTTYYLILAAHGIELKIPTDRLVSVALRDRDDYVRFLKSQHAGAFQTTRGYYHPTFRAVVTLQHRTDRSEPRTTDLSLDPKHRDLNRRHLLDECQKRAFEDGTAAHEMIHLLVNESGLAPSAERFPLWLHEGFASQFEVVRGGRWAGVGRAHDLRLPDWGKGDRVIDLEAFLNDAGFGRGYDSALYARSWALVYYLRKVHPERFHVYLDLLRNPETRGDGTRPATSSERFRKVFEDDLVGFETEWRRYINGVKTPLDENAPRNSPAAFLGSRN